MNPKGSKAGGRRPTVERGAAFPGAGSKPVDQTEASSPKVNEEIRGKVIAMWRQHIPLVQIGAAIGYSKETARSVVNDYLESWREQNAQTVNDTVVDAVARLDGMLSKLAKKIALQSDDPDERTVDAYCKVMDRKLALMGVSANKLDVTSGGEKLPAARVFHVGIEVVDKIRTAASDEPDDDDDESDRG